MEDVIELKTKVQEKLKLYGLRPTRARTRIGMMLLDKPKHLSADQVHEKLKQKGYTLPTEIKLLGLIPNLPKSSEQKANPCGCRDRGKTQKKALPGPDKIGQHLGFLDKERSRAVHMVGKYFPQRFFTQKDAGAPETKRSAILRSVGR